MLGGALGTRLLAASPAPWHVPAVRHSTSWGDKAPQMSWSLQQQGCSYVHMRGAQHSLTEPPTSSSTPRARRIQPSLFWKRLCSQSSCLPPKQGELGPLGALALVSQQCSDRGRLVGSVPRLCFDRAKAQDFLPGLEPELQKGNLVLKVISNRNRNLERFAPGAPLSTTKTPHLNPKPSKTSTRTYPLAAKSTRFPPN